MLNVCRAKNPFVFPVRTTAFLSFKNTTHYFWKSPCRLPCDTRPQAKDYNWPRSCHSTFRPDERTQDPWTIDRRECGSCLVFHGTENNDENEFQKECVLGYSRQKSLPFNSCIHKRRKTHCTSGLASKHESGFQQKTVKDRLEKSVL